MYSLAPYSCHSNKFRLPRQRHFKIFTHNVDVVSYFATCVCFFWGCEHDLPGFFLYMFLFWACVKFTSVHIPNFAEFLQLKVHSLRLARKGCQAKNAIIDSLIRDNF